MKAPLFLRGLRARVTAAGMGAMALVLALVFLGVQFTAEWLLHREFDETLSLQSRAIVQRVVALEWDLSGRFPLPATDAERAGYYFEIHVLRTDVWLPSRNLGEHHLPEPGSTGSTPIFETIRAEKVVARFPGMGTLRMVSTRCVVPEVGPVDVLVATPEAPLQHALRTLRRTFLVLLPLAILVTGVVTWNLVRRAMQALDRVAQEAARRDRALLFEPLPEPPGEDELTRMVRTVNALLARSGELLAAQERFNANAAHELKSPVARVLGHAQVLLQRERPAADYVEFTRLVEEEMRRLRGVVESLLVLARLDQPTRASTFVAVSLREVAVDAVQAVRAAAGDREVELRLQLPEEDAGVQGDAGLLQVLLENLLRNALRHAPRGSTVELTLLRSAELCEVTVSDRGPGFPPEVLEHLFEPFVASEPGGSGLGLSLAAAVARAHGGALRAGNAAECGAWVRVELPLAAGPMASAPGEPV